MNTPTLNPAGSANLVAQSSLAPHAAAAVGQYTTHSAVATSFPHEPAVLSHAQLSGVLRGLDNAYEFCGSVQAWDSQHTMREAAAALSLLYSEVHRLRESSPEPGDYLPERCPRSVAGAMRPFLKNDATPQQMWDAMRLDLTKVAPEPSEQPVPAGDKFLTEEDFATLFTFHNQCSDCDADGYTVCKEDMQRLAELGCVSDEGRGRYAMTRFGDWLIESSFLQKSTLPLQTIADFNAASKKSSETKGMQHG